MLHLLQCILSKFTFLFVNIQVCIVSNFFPYGFVKKFFKKSFQIPIIIADDEFTSLCGERQSEIIVSVTF